MADRADATRTKDVATSLLRLALERPGATGSLKVFGSCMEPLLHTGDRIEVVRLGRSIRVGDLVLFQGREGLACHRLVALRGDRCLLRGDSSPRAEAVSVEGILGRVKAIRRDSRVLDLRRAPWSWRSRALGRLANLRWRAQERRVPRPVHRVGGVFLRWIQRVVAGS